MHRRAATSAPGMLLLATSLLACSSPEKPDAAPTPEPQTAAEAAPPTAPSAQGAEAKAGEPEMALAGQAAPAFALTGHDGKQVALTDLVADGPAVLIFYRGDWCPICRKQLGEVQGRLADFEAKNATVVAM